MRSNQKRPSTQAKADIERLFALADAAFAEHPERATRYVALARTLGMRQKIRLSSAQQRKFCKHCYAYIRSGVNGRVRLSRGQIVLTCFSCKKFTRFGYRREQKARRATALASRAVKKPASARR